MAKNGYSRKGFFGEIIHYDARGRKVGESRKNFWVALSLANQTAERPGASLLRKAEAALSSFS